MRKRNKILIGIAAMLLLTAALMAQGSKSARGFVHNRWGAGFLIAEYLELTDAQKTVLEEAREEGRPELLADLARLRTAKKAIRDAVRNNAAPNEIRSLSDELGNTVAEVAARHATRAAQIKTDLNLTPVQMEKIDKLVAHFDERADRFWGWLDRAAPPLVQP
jgi:Spy/CpxP family protein refolding chaperone